MVDFSSLLRKPISDVKKPEPLPAGNYPAIVKGHEFGESQQKKTPYVRFLLIPTGWPEDVTPIEGVDLSKKTLRRDYYLTEDAEYRLAEFLQDLGLSGSFEETIPQATGMPVLMAVTQRLDERTNDTFNDVQRVGKLE